MQIASISYNLSYIYIYIVKTFHKISLKWRETERNGTDWQKTAGNTQFHAVFSLFCSVFTWFHGETHEFQAFSHRNMGKQSVSAPISQDSPPFLPCSLAFFVFVQRSGKEPKKIGVETAKEEIPKPSPAPVGRYGHMGMRSRRWPLVWICTFKKKGLVKKDGHRFKQILVLRLCHGHRLYKICIRNA